MGKEPILELADELLGETANSILMNMIEQSQSEAFKKFISKLLEGGCPPKAVLNALLQTQDMVGEGDG